MQSPYVFTVKGVMMENIGMLQLQHRICSALIVKNDMMRITGTSLEPVLLVELWDIITNNVPIIRVLMQLFFSLLYKVEESWKKALPIAKRGDERVLVMLM